MVVTKKKKGLLQTGEIGMTDLKYLTQHYMWGSFYQQSDALKIFNFHPPGESKVFKDLIVSYSPTIKFIRLETDMFGGAAITSPLLLSNAMIANILKRAQIEVYQMFGKDDIWLFRPVLSASEPFFEKAHVTVGEDCCYCGIFRKTSLKPGQVYLTEAKEEDEFRNLQKYVIAWPEATLTDIDAYIKEHPEAAKKNWAMPANKNGSWFDEGLEGEELIRLNLGEEELEIPIERSYSRKTVTLYCNSDGLKIKAPETYPIAKIVRFVDSKIKWIGRSLDRAKQKSAITEEWNQKIFAEKTLPWLGSYKKFEVVEKGDPAPLTDEADFQITVPQGQKDNKKAIADGLLSYLGPVCHKYFLTKLLNKVSEIGDTGRPFTNLRLSSATTRWGSCKGNGTIFLNWRLIMMDEAFLDYVICHELAHLKVMKHDAAFWSTVESYCPNYKEIEKRMKQYTLRNFPL